MKIRFFLYVSMLLGISAGAQIDPKDLPPPPRPPRLVNDLADVLSPDQESLLENKLVAYNDSTSTQIAVVTIQSTGPYVIEDYALSVGRYWGVGQAEMNNGIVVLAAIADRAVTIQTGYGTEAYITDGIAKRIIETDILPAFRTGDYYLGLDAATTNIIAYMSGAYDALPETPEAFNWWEFIILVIIIIIILSILGRFNKGGGVTYSGRGPTYWGGGGFGGGGGGFGGGGFGGFGGGSFGGGGASGRW